MEIISWSRLARFAFLFLALSSLVSTAQAATYYVAPNGSNSSPGTLSAPFATLQKAHDVANPGDTIYMRGGTYMLVGQVGLPAAAAAVIYIEVFNYPGEYADPRWIAHNELRGHQYPHGECRMVALQRARDQKQS